MNPSFIISLLAFLFILDQFLSKRSSKRSSYGLLWLALSFFCWVPLYLLIDNMDLDRASGLITLITFSQINNIFILLSYPYFQYASFHVRLPFFNRSFSIAEDGAHWLIFILSLTVLCFFGTLIGLAILSPGNSEIISNKWILTWPVTVISAFSYVLLGWAIIRTFYYRNRFFMMWASGITFLLFITYQFYPLAPGETETFIGGLMNEGPLSGKDAIGEFSFIIKSCFILIVYRLTATWIEEKGDIDGSRSIRRIELYCPEEIPASLKQAVFQAKITINNKYVNQDIQLNFTGFKALLFLIAAQKSGRQGGYTSISKEKYLGKNDFDHLLKQIAINIKANESVELSFEEVRKQVRPSAKDYNYGLARKVQELKTRINPFFLEKRGGERRLIIEHIESQTSIDKLHGFFLFIEQEAELSLYKKAEVGHIRNTLSDLKEQLKIQPQATKE